MPGWAVKINQEQTNENKFEINKKLNFVLIQNHKILVILLCLQAKLQLFQDHTALLFRASN